jgi:hypothetical protein
MMNTFRTKRGKISGINMQLKLHNHSEAASHTMLRCISILLLSVATILAADEKPQREVFRLRATVLDIVLLSRYSGTVMPVGVDPRFAVTMRVESITPSLTKFTKGGPVTFAVHSPSQLFAAEDAKGKTFDFNLYRDTANGKTTYSNLEVRR